MLMREVPFKTLYFVEIRKSDGLISLLIFQNYDEVGEQEDKKARDIATSNATDIAMYLLL